MNKDEIKVPSVYGVGIVTVGTKINGRKIKSYSKWHDMLNRCYNESNRHKNKSYKGCSVCEEWIYYSNFKKWYDENYYEVDEEKMQLDKDILHKGNKIYSPDNCIFVPKNINVLFTKRDSERGMYPIGVYCNGRKDKVYMARCSNGEGKSVFLGRYNTPEEAFFKYKEFKDKLIKKIADSYKHKIPKILYETLCSYEVKITD